MHHRTEEREQLKRKLGHGINIHMPAPRRIGKTWTVSRLADDLRRDGWVAVEVDVEGSCSVEAFARELCKRIEDQHSIKDRFKTHFWHRFGKLVNGFDGDNPVKALAHIQPIEFVETLIESLNHTDKPCAILIDEVAYFFLALAETDAGQARDFAYQLRALQQRYKNVRWLLTGSIGLHIIARRYGFEGAFVDLENFVLDIFSPQQALSYMRDPDIQRQFNHVFDASDATFAHMFTHLGWLAPYYLKMIANEVRPSIKGPGQPQATEADMDTAFEKLLAPNRQSEFAVWREHISKNLPPNDSAIARTLLGALCAQPAGEMEATLFAVAQQHAAAVQRRQVQEILAMLLTDGLITYSDGRYAFRSGLIRRYWHAYEAE